VVGGGGLFKISLGRVLMSRFCLGGDGVGTAAYRDDSEGGVRG